MKKYNIFSLIKLLSFILGICLSLEYSYAQNPGGVSGAELWLKANDGPDVTTSGDNIGLWEDKLGSGDLSPVSAATAPDYRSSSTENVNFNPYIDFNLSSNDRLNGGNYNITGTADLQMFFVYQQTSQTTGTYPDLWDFDGGPFNDERIEAFEIGTDNRFYVGGADGTSPNKSLYSSDLSSFGTWILGVGMFLPNNDILSRVNGDLSTEIGVQDGVFQGDGNVSIGTHGELDANIAEIIYYSGQRTPTQLQQIESYLALKYGITLDQTSQQDYLASNGVTMWDASVATTGFNNNIFGIGKDTGSDLEQNISKSVNKDGILILANGTTTDFTSGNSGRTPTQDIHFQTIANNGIPAINANVNNNASWVLSDAPDNYQIANRQWQVQEHDNVAPDLNEGVNDVTLAFDVEKTGNGELNLPLPLYGESQYYLVLDRNNNGSYNDAGDEVITLSNSGYLWYATLDLDHLDRFTLATLDYLQVIGNDENDSTASSANLTASQLNAITGVSGAIVSNESGYQAYIDSNENRFSSPATVSEVLVMINSVNALAEVLEDSQSPGGNNNGNGTAISLTQLNSIYGIPNIVDPINLAEYQTAINNYTGFSNLPTLAEVITVLNTVNATHNKSIHLDGFDDYIYLGDTLDFEMVNNPDLTIEAWVKTSSTSNQTIISKIDGGIGWIFQVRSDGRFYFSFNQGSYRKSRVGRPNDIGVNILDGNWHHIAVVYTGSSGSFGYYVDGTPVGSSGNNYFSGNITTTANTGSARIGPSFNGNMDDVKVWNIALDATTIANNYNTERVGNEANLLAYYKFDQENGCAIDVTLSEFHGTLIGPNGGNYLPQYSTDLAPILDITNANTNSCPVNTLLLAIGTDANDGIGTGGNSIPATASELNNLPNVSEAIDVNLGAYQTFVNNNVGSMSIPATVAEVQIMINHVNLLVAIGIDANDGSTVGGNSIPLSAPELNNLVNVSGALSTNLGAYQEYVDNNVGAMSSPATTAEVQIMIDAVNAQQSLLEAIGIDANDGAGTGGNSIPNTALELNNLPNVSGAIDVNLSEYQEYVNDNLGSMSSPATVQEVQIMVTVVNLLVAIGTDANDGLLIGGNSIPENIGPLHLIPGLTSVLGSNLTAYQYYVDNNTGSMSSPATIGQVQTMIDVVNASFDADNDGTPDHLDADDDNDGVLDLAECPSGAVSVTNADFNANSGLPTTYFQINNLSDWYIASEYSPHYLHFSGFFSDGFMGTFAPSTDGDGFIGFYIFGNSDRGYIASNTNITSGFTYQINFETGLPSGGTTVSSLTSETQIVLYGIPLSTNLPFDGNGDPTFASIGAVELARLPLVQNGGTWVDRSIPFVADGNFQSIVIGVETSTESDVIFVGLDNVSIHNISCDSDGDGLPDRIESNSIDSDGDGNMDFMDADADADGVADGSEQIGVEIGPWLDTDNDGIPDHLDKDNGDGTGTTIAGSGDSDGDGVSDADECPTGYICADTNSNGIPNYAESDITITPSTPGGVSTDIALWLKADQDVEHSSGNISVWGDQTTNDMDATGINSPTFNTNGSNFNPRIDFDRSLDQYFQLPSGFSDFTAGFTAFAVINFTSVGSYERIFDFGNGQANNNIFLSRTGSNPTSFTYGSYDGSSMADANIAGVIENNYNRIYSVSSPMGIGGTQVIPSIIKNGYEIIHSQLVAIPNNIIRTSNYIGKSNWNDAYFNGNMSEIILFNKELSVIEKQKINSYLAIKYGVTLDQAGSVFDVNVSSGDYIASDGSTIIWNAPTNSFGAYNNDIFGIGRDDNSGLHQSISKSESSDALLILSLTNDFTNTNIGRNHIVSDTNFVMIANNDEALSWQTTELCPCKDHARLSREWRMQVTGNSIDSVYISIAKVDLDILPSNSELYLMLDEDGDFAVNPYTVFKESEDGTHFYFKIPAIHNQYMTLAFVKKTSYLRGGKRFLFGELKSFAK